MRIFLIFIGCCLLLSCKKSEVDTGQSYDMIVEGGINTMYKEQYIQLKKLDGLHSNGMTVGVSGATVQIVNGPNTIEFEELGEGLYMGELFNLKDTVGNIFQLRIALNGKLYEAQDQLVPTVPIEKAFLPVEKRGINNSWEVKVSKHLFGMKTSNKWLIIPQKDFSNEDISTFRLPFSYSYRLGAPNVLNTLLGRTYNYEMSKKDSLMVFKLSVSPRYARFLYNLFQETEWKGLLSAVPANVEGNVSGNTLGFFYVMDGVYKTIPIKDIRNSK
ncbi:hypothetical protein [Sphingobacterium zeae]|uniref:DUF4249 domain-containing protein n=2 Tax=Sphingobacterium TaxID=28453 RepID=A0ABU0U1Y3_9SPHI|nr:hypothetical protein [Sphingobacterium zeae]MDQ1148962.1 hypothetical protein [Sphingobacterium zeae]